MSWFLAVFFKPFVVLAYLLTVRAAELAVWRWLPPGKLRNLLLRKF